MMVNEVVKRGTCSVGKHTLTENKAAAGVVGSEWYLGTYISAALPPNSRASDQVQSSH